MWSCDGVVLGPSNFLTMSGHVRCGQINPPHGGQDVYNNIFDSYCALKGKYHRWIHSNGNID